jgi:4-azaleucine resistance transporter AzlC
METSNPSTTRPSNASMSRAGLVRGVGLAAAVAPGVAGAGLIYGALCRASAVSGTEAALKSILVAAGTSQFAVIELWTRPVPLLSVTVVALLVNARYSLMGAALPAWFGELSPSRRLLSAYFLCDESWALSARDYRDGRADAGILIGSGVAVYISWALGTSIGYASAGSLRIQSVPGLEFLVPAALLAVLAGFWPGGRAGRISWGVAAVVAVACAHLLPGSWYVVLGAAAGMLAGATSHGA